MLYAQEHICGDCHFIALKRHLSLCKKPCNTCPQKKPQHVCKNRVRDYCTNENIVGRIDRTYPACKTDFLMLRSSALRVPFSPLKKTRDRRHQDAT